MTKKITAIILALLLNSAILFSLNSVSAYEFGNDSGLSKTGGQAGYQEGGLDDSSLPELIGKFIKVALMYLGIFFFLLTFYAGYLWMTSRGNSKDVENAKKILENAIIGIVIILISYAVTYFLMDILTKPKADK